MVDVALFEYLDRVDAYYDVAVQQLQRCFPVQAAWRVPRRLPANVPFVDEDYMADMFDRVELETAFEEVVCIFGESITARKIIKVYVRLALIRLSQTDLLVRCGLIISDVFLRTFVLKNFVREGVCQYLREALKKKGCFETVTVVVSARNSHKHDTAVVLRSCDTSVKLADD